MLDVIKSELKKREIIKSLIINTLESLIEEKKCCGVRVGKMQNLICSKLGLSQNNLNSKLIDNVIQSYGIKRRGTRGKDFYKNISLKEL